MTTTALRTILSSHTRPRTKKKFHNGRIKCFCPEGSAKLEGDAGRQGLMACRIPKKTAQLSLHILRGLAPFLDIQNLFVFFPRFVRSIGTRAAPGPDVGVVYNK